MLKILAIETCVRVVQAGGILYSVCANIQRFPLSNLPIFLKPPPPHTHTHLFILFVRLLSILLLPLPEFCPQYFLYVCEECFIFFFECRLLLV